MSLTLSPPRAGGNRSASREAVTGLLQRLTARYGTQFMDRFGAVPQDVLIDEWAAGLGGYTVGEVERGMAALTTARFPPTLPEFLALCRPPIDAADAFTEAARNMALRDAGQNPQWQHPAIFWAAVEFGGYDLRHSGYTPGVRARWERLLAAELAKGEWRPLPVVLPALPAPRRGTKPNPLIAQRLRQAVERMKGGAA